MFDYYSLLHFISGFYMFIFIALFFPNISFAYSFIILFISHALFEIVENSKYGIAFLSKIKIWPGGKEKPDSLLNSVGDQISAILGWGLAFIIFTKL